MTKRTKLHVLLSGGVFISLAGVLLAGCANINASSPPAGQTLPPPRPVSGPNSLLPNALPGRPQSRAEAARYRADMRWLVTHLHDSGLKAHWPASGNDDCFDVVLPSGATRGEAQELAARVYVKMALLRRTDGYSETDFTQCVVTVSDPAGHPLAADRRGKLE